MAAPLSVAVIQLDEARLFSPFTLKQLIHLKVLIYQNDQNICKYSASLITTYQKANTAFVGKLIKNEIRRFPPSFIQMCDICRCDEETDLLSCGINSCSCPVHSGCEGLC